MSDEKSKAGPPARPSPPSGSPPTLDRVPAGYRPPALRPAAPAASVPSAPAPRPAAAPSRPAGAPSYGLAAREVGADAALAAGIAHQGSLSGDSALRLFGLAAATQATGRLTLAAQQGRSFALTFRRGTVEHAASSDAEDDLGRFLLRRGALTGEALARAELAGGDLVTALLAERLVNPADVAALLQEHGSHIVQRALSVDAGTWSWDPQAAPPPGAFPLGAPFTMLCAALRGLDAAALLGRLGDREHRVASRVIGRIRVEDLRLTPQETRAAALFDGGRSPAEIASAAPGDALVVLRMAVLLGELELLAFGATRKGTSAPPVRQPPRESPAPAPPAAATPRPAPAMGGKERAPAAKAAAPAQKAPPSRAAPAASAPKPAPSAAPLDAAALEALYARLKDADHFTVLGVKQDATGPQIKIAYFQLAKAYHPDAVPAGAAAATRKLCADVFAKVSEAWSVLGEDASRAAYLDRLRSGGSADVDVMAILQAESLFQEGTVLVKGRKYDEAARKFEQAIALNPEEAEFGMWRVWCEFLLADDKRTALGASSTAVEAGLKRNPRCAQGYLFLAQMAKLAGDLPLAEKQLKRGLQVAPDHADMQRELKYLRK